METSHEQHVRQLARDVHPSWPPRPKFWFHANPTIVALEKGKVVGYGCYTVDNHPAGNSFIMYLRDSGVSPDVQGRGVGQALLQKRMDVGKHLGINMFVGCTAPTNLPMRSILKKAGFHRCQTAQGYFAFNNPPEDGLIYIHSGDEHED
jgi:RimJ/RimL family protein N-acetyltransferase